jgi:hypothetical protein
LAGRSTQINYRPYDLTDYWESRTSLLRAEDDSRQVTARCHIFGTDSIRLEGVGADAG